MTRKITKLEKITHRNQMKVGEYYVIGGGESHMDTLVKCIYVDLFGFPVFLHEDRKDSIPIKIADGTSNYYLVHRGITHVKVEEPQSGFCWVVTYINKEGTVFSFTTPKPDAYTVGGRDGTCTILSIKKVQWTEGENDYDASE